MNGKLFVIAAPSGAGKTTLVEAVIGTLAPTCSLSRVITYTTKTPRMGEQNGKDYHFLSVSEFEKRIEESFFLEWSLAYGHYYGSPASLRQFLEQGASFIIIVDRLGASRLLERVSESVLIWVTVPTIEILEKRLLLRNTETPEQIKRRLQWAQQEMEEENGSDLFTYCIENDCFEIALKKLETIILQELK